jgi:hypothetical protein
MKFQYLSHLLSVSHPYSHSDTAEKSALPEDLDEDECQICMDKEKEVVLPCTHSFCLVCYRNWSIQNQTCPICRTVIRCSEGEELYELTNNEASDMQAYANDLVARVYEFLEKMPLSPFSEEDAWRSSMECLEAEKGILSHGGHEGSAAPPVEDYLFAVRLASGQDQYEAERMIQTQLKDNVLAVALSMQVVEEEEEGDEGGRGDEE